VRIIERDEIVAGIDLDLAVQRIEEGFIAFSAGKVQVPPVQMFAFAAANGDCCVKSAFIEGSETFTVKVSTGFYDNPGKDLPSNDGLMLVLSANDGRPLALLQDQGWLTGMRTALAGRIAARFLAPRDVRAIGMLGTGMQARLQLEQLRPVTTCRRVIAWGRNDAELASYRAFAAGLGFDVQVTREAKTLAEGANLIVCATPSREALIARDWIRPGTHITAVGADAPGKQELDPLLVGRADRIIVDSIVQCRQYGEVSHALKAGLIDEGQLGEIGSLAGWAH